MNTTRKQRRDYIKMMKKKFPNMSKAKLQEIKDSMTEIGKLQHQDNVKQAIEERGVKILNAENIDELNEIGLDDDDFSPENLED